MAQINKPDTYFNTVTWSGTSATQSITGVGFQPDFLWVKARNQAYQHSLRDVIRGSTKTLRSNGANAEQTQLDSVTSFDSNGFTLGADASAFVNDSTATYVGWNWLAGGTGVSNTDGSITSTVSANTTSGFSIVTWTGDGNNMTVGHGLGVTPDVVLIKNRDNGTSNWVMRHKSLGNSNMLRLNDNTTGFTSTDYIVPTATTFSGQASTALSTLGEKVVGYCFAEKKGFSKFGSYTGNGNADGTFVYTGFKPAWVMIKDTTNSLTNWMIYDNKRDIDNPAIIRLFPNDSLAEISNSGVYDIDLLSNGFKIKTTNNNFNSSGANHIYMAFAENPLVGTNNIPATAR